MKPDFTLALSSETIQLLHRVDGGWFVVGTADVGDPDLADRLAALRARALGLGNGAPFGTKLLIPNEQIRYLSLDTTRADEDDVRAALAGATPYPVSDLVYDFVTGGGRTYIAAVARRTLAEAEAFAVTHQMAPLSFCAAPEPFTYLGEAFFGPTRASRDILPFGTFLDRDALPVAIIGHVDGGEVAKAEQPGTLPPFLTEMTVTAATPDQHGAVLSEERGEAAEPLPEPSSDDQTVFAAVPASAPAGPHATSASSEAGAGTEGGGTSRSAPGAGAGSGPTFRTDAPGETTAGSNGSGAVASDANAGSTASGNNGMAEAPPAAEPWAPHPPRQIRLGGEPSVSSDRPAAGLDPNVAANEPPSDPPSAPLFSARPRGAGQTPASGTPAAPRAPEAPRTEAATGNGPAMGNSRPGDPASSDFVPSFASRREPTNPPRTAASQDRPHPVEDAGGVSDAGFTTRRDPTNPPKAPSPAPFPPREAALEGAAPGGFVSRQEPTYPPAPPVPPRPGPTAEAGPRLRAEPPMRAAPVQPVPAPAESLGGVGPQAAPPSAADRDLPQGASPSQPEPTLAVPQPEEVVNRPAGMGPIVTADSVPGGPAPALKADVRPSAAAPDAGGGLFSRRGKGAAAAQPADLAPDVGTPQRRVGGKPRFLGLVLTVLLLVFMAAVAAMAAFSDEGLAWLFGDEAPEQAEIAAAPDLGETTAPAQPASEAAPVAPPSLPAGADAPRPQAPGGSLAAPSAESAPQLDPDSAPQEARTASDVAEQAEQPPAGRVLSPDEARRRYAATGVWQRAPRLPLTPRSQVLDDLSEATAPDPVARITSDTIPEPAAYTTDLSFLAPPLPPPPGVTFPRDADGFILATPEGTVLPSGAVVFAGRPDLVPPIRGGLPEPEPLVAEDGLIVWEGSPTLEPPVRSGIPQEALPPEVAAAPVEDVVAAEEGLLVVAGAPAVTPPVRVDVPDPVAEPATEALPDGAIVAEDGLLVLAGAPPLAPPARPVPPAAALSPEPAMPVDDGATISEEPAALSADSDIATPGSDSEAVVTVEPDPAAAEADAAATVDPDAAAPDAEAVATAGPNAALAEGEVVVLESAPPLTPPARTAPEVALPTAPGGRTALLLSDDLVVVAGAPAIAPPVRAAGAVPDAAPTDAAEEAGATPETAPTDISAPGPDDPVEILAPDGLQLAAFRPSVRPATLEVPAGALLPTDPTLAGFRPNSRPAGLAPPPGPEPVAAEEPEPPATPDPEAVLAAAIANAVEEASTAAAARLVDVTRQAVAVSARPDLRPRNFARVVEQARRNQQRQEAAAQQAAARQAPAVPRAAAAAPSAPTPRSVGAAATLENAINLRQISLIGVYGTASNRRALVRLGNGRYDKVSVGDRLDGGRVAAIGESHLDYTKRGRTARLEMPRG